MGCVVKLSCGCTIEINLHHHGQGVMGVTYAGAARMCKVCGYGGWGTRMLTCKYSPVPHGCYS